MNRPTIHPFNHLQCYNTAVFGSIIASALFMPSVLGAGIVIEPVPASQEQLGAQDFEELSHASVDIEGKGTNFRINYSSSSPIDLYILFLNKDGALNPRDILYAKLAEGNLEVSVPVSSSRGWSAGTRKYKLHFLAPKNSSPLISSVELTGKLSLPEGVMQFFAQEPYTPSSYHRLEGYRLYGVSFTAILLVISLTILFSRLLIKNPAGIFSALLIVILAYNARFSLDALRYSIVHAHEYFVNRTYASAGSAYEIAGTLKKLKIEKISLCSDGNTYFKTLLNYAAYPAKVSDDSDFVLVRNAFDWTYENGILNCSGISSAAEKSAEFPDGSIIFRLSS